MRSLLMKCPAICLLLAASLGAAFFTSRACAYTYWNDLRHSALLPDNTITVRMESPTGAGVENRILYAGSGITEQVMTPVLDGPSTLEATVPGPVASARSYGFRLIQGTEIDFAPVHIAGGVTPAPGDLTRLAQDPSGDALYGYVNLDLVDCHVSFSGERLYASLTNAGGGFPVSSGLTFFGYLLAVANPALSDPDTVFALMHTYNQPGIITPGLYKIVGTGFSDLIKIGDVVVQEYPALNTLMISCRLSDLMADPYFQSWYDTADPAIGVAGFTQRITLLGGAVEADRTPGGQCYLREFTVAPETNVLPVLSGFRLEGAGVTAIAAIDYLDSNPNCPVVAEMVFDDTLTFPMYPQTLDYGSAVTYRTAAGIAPLADDSWTEALVRFSDDLTHVIEYVPLTNGVETDPIGGVRSGLSVAAAPSPFSDRTQVMFRASRSGMARADIFDCRGALVRTLAGQVTPGQAQIEWDGRDAGGHRVQPGIYFCRVTAGGESAGAKMVVLD
jgi:hypothetical protein